MRKLLFLGGEDVSARIEISKKFIALGYSVEIIGTEKEDKFINNNITYKKYSLNREFNIVDDIKTILELRSILKEQIDEIIVHAFDTKPTMFLPLSAIGLKNIKVVKTITGMGRIFTDDSLKNNILRFIYNSIQKIVSKRVDFTIFQNDDDYRYFLENRLIDNINSEVIKSSGIDLKKTIEFQATLNIETLKNDLDIDNNKITFILVSRMVKQKGILNYLEAAKLCYENGFNYNFLLVGQLDTKQDSISEEIINSYSKYVKYLGRREDIGGLLSVSDISVLPTYYREGVPRVLLEASAYALSLIATDMPGCRDVVIDEYNGKLVKIKDSYDLYEKMIYIAEDKQLLSKFSCNAKKHVENFDLNIIVDKYNKVYKKIEEKIL